ncbi:MAG: hypothetical protein EOP19_13285, partial [Hyphomicrobiales bacterium]
MRIGCIAPAAGRRTAKLSDKVLVGASAATLLLLTMTTPSFAFNDRVLTQHNRIVYCVRLLLTDPQQHARECGSGSVSRS